MRTKALAFGGLILAAFAIQTALLPFLGFGPFRPDLLLVLCVLAGLAFGPREGLGVGLAAGLLQDLAAGRFLGLFTLAGTGVGYLAGLAAQKVYRDRFVAPFLAGFGATLLQRVVILLILKLGGVPTGSALWPGWLWGEALINAAAALALLGPALHLERWLRSEPRTPPRRRSSLGRRTGRYVARH